MNKKHVSRVSLTLPQFHGGFERGNCRANRQRRIVDRYRAKRKVVCKLQHGRRQLFSITNEVRTEPGSNPRHNNLMIWIKYLHGNNGV